ncbi:MAG: YihY/virulence factor BrkB family protein [Miltoncostaeaceae bacterium]
MTTEEQATRSTATPAHVRPLAAVGAFARGVIGRSARDDITAIGSQFAYNALLATVPFLFIVISVIGLLASPDTFERSVIEGDASFSDDLQNTLESALRSATQNTREAAVFLVIGIAGGLYLSANVMGALVGGLDRARGVEHRRWGHGRLVALGFAAGASALVVATSLAMVGGPRMINAIAEEVGADPDIGQRIITPLGAGSLLVFVLFLYLFGPNAPRRRLLAELPGAVAAVALWVGASRLFSLYVDNFDSYNRVYGVLGFVVVYLIFLFLTGVVILFGAEINAQLQARRDAAQEREFAEGM